VPLLDPGDDRRIVDHQGAPGLDASVPFVNGLGSIVPDAGEVVALAERDAHLHVLMECPLVVLERQDVDALLVENLLGDLALAAHGINGHHTPGQGQIAQELGQGGDLVGLGLHCRLGQDQPVGTRPGTHQVDGGLPLPRSCEPRTALPSIAITWVGRTCSHSHNAPHTLTCLDCLPQLDVDRGERAAAMGRHFVLHFHSLDDE